jgi:hypothetical protein
VASYTPGPIEGITPPGDTAPPFTARIYGLEEVNLAVDAPAEVSEWFGDRGYVPVLGALDEITIRATLCPAGGGRHRLYLNGPMREATGTGEGDEVCVTLWRDDGHRSAILPDDLREALAAAGALEAFTAWPPSHQLEYVRAIEDAKRPDTRRNRIERTVAAAVERGP